MSVINKNSARLRDEERARLIWLLTTDKAIISTLLGKLTLAEQYDVGTLADDIAEVGALVAHLPPPDLADTLEALPSEERHALWRLVESEKRGNVLLEASENVWDDLIDEMSHRELLDALHFATTRRIDIVCWTRQQMEGHTHTPQKMLPAVVTKSSASAADLLNQTFHSALTQRASDIHFEPEENHYRIRLRVDGVLHALPEVTTEMGIAITARL